MIALRASVGDTLHLLARRSTVRGMNVFVNPTPGVPGIVVLPSGGFRRAKAAITAWEGYAPTPLHQIMRGVWLKDEGPRFGLCSFKALGGGYAVEKLAAGQQGKITVTCATDGNHGRAVAWGAQRAGCRCIIFVHATVSQGRIDAIARYGAEVRVVPGTYDDAVRAAAVEAEKAGWTVVSDTSYPGYTEIPRDVMQGYRLMADEAADQWAGPPPTHVFMQAGVGGAAAAVSVQMRARFDPVPRMIVVEPETAACLYESARAGKVVAVGGALETIMAGLACGEPSLLAWQELQRSALAFVTIPDVAAIRAVQFLAERNLAIGESGAAGLGAYLSLDATEKCALGLDSSSRILLFGTEGVTDRKVYANILASRQI